MRRACSAEKAKAKRLNNNLCSPLLLVLTSQVASLVHSRRGSGLDLVNQDLRDLLCSSNPGSLAHRQADHNSRPYSATLTNCRRNLAVP